jgi:hypothetical protein
MDKSRTLVSGITDAVPLDANNRIEAAVDWKSDIETSMAKLAGCRAQLGDYRKQTGTKRALLVPHDSSDSPGRVMRFQERVRKRAWRQVRCSSESPAFLY